MKCGLKFLPIAFWGLMTVVCLGGMALRPTWNDSDYYIQLVNMAAVGIKPHVDYPHIYTLLSTWIMMPLKAFMGSCFSPTSMSVLVGLFYLAVARMVFSMARKLQCPPVACHAGAALTVFLGISSGHLQFTLEPWCVFFGTLSLWCVICGKPTLMWMASAGFFAASTFLCKQNGGIFLVAVPVCAWAFLPRECRWRNLTAYGMAVVIAFVVYLFGTRLWLGDWSAVPTFFGRVPYSRSMNVAKGEAFGTLVKSVVWSAPVWLAIVLSGKSRWQEKLALLFGCLLLVPAVIVSPGDHNRYFVAPFLGLLLGVGVRDRFNRWVVVLMGLYLAEVALRGFLYFQEPIANLCDHGSIYSRDDLELVSCLRKCVKAGDRLLVVPKDGGASVARFYVLTDAVPATLEVRHQENLGWGTEFMYGDDELLQRSIGSATVFAVHRQSTFDRCAAAVSANCRKIAQLPNWEVFAR